MAQKDDIDALGRGGPSGAKELQTRAAAGEDIVKADTDYQIGDRYTYRRMDLFSKVEDRRHTLRVTGLADIQVIFNDGRRITDRLGNDIVTVKGNKSSGQQVFVPEYGIGKKWSTRFRFTKADGAEFDVTYDFEVVAKEQITVPAGTFDTYRVEGGGYMHQTSGNRKLKKSACAELNTTFKIWVAPDKVRRYVAEEFIQRGAYIGCNYKVAIRTELVSFRQGGQAAGVARPDAPGSEK